MEQLNEFEQIDDFKTKQQKIDNFRKALQIAQGFDLKDSFFIQFVMQ